MAQQLLSAFTGSLNSAVFCWSEGLLNKVRMTVCLHLKTERSLVISEKPGTEWAAMLGLAGWHAASVISDLHYVGFPVHDLRRTGCRNLRRLGVQEKTIVKIGGWKTRSVFDRYNIVDAKGLAEAAALLDAKAQQRKLRHIGDTVNPKPGLGD